MRIFLIVLIVYLAIGWLLLGASVACGATERARKKSNASMLAMLIGMLYAIVMWVPMYSDAIRNTIKKRKDKTNE